MSALKLKQKNDKEKRIHSALYNNIELLTFTYPTTKEFNQVFQKDMFVKSNKAAFLHVVYYLLKILNPEVIKQKLPSWPPFDSKIETQFRKEVMLYLNELNATYEGHTFPKVMTSLLITPGGYKFAVLMLKLSNLVLQVHLRRHLNNEENLEQPKPMKNVDHTKIILTTCSKETANINRECNKMKLQFSDRVDEFRNEANTLSDKIEESKNLVSTLKVKMDQIEEDTKFNLREVEDEIKKYQLAVDKIADIRNKFNFIGDSLEDMCYVNKIEYNPGDIYIPEEVSHIININDTKLDLIKLLQALSIFIGNKIFKFKTVTTEEMKDGVISLSEQHEELMALSHKLHDMKARINEMLKDVQKKAFVTKAETIKKNTQKSVPHKENSHNVPKLKLNDMLFDTSDTVLATLLPDSPSDDVTISEFNI